MVPGLLLDADERQECHVAGPFQCLRHHPLVLGAGSGFGGGQNLGVRRHKAAQELGVLVVDVGNLFCAEKTRFLGLLSSHVSG